MSANRLTSLPEELGHCTALRLLDVSGNQISELPRSLGKLARLRTFKAAANQLNFMPEEMLQVRIELCLKV
jgi:Leucine-rich repeat (LRR) protein